MCVIYWHCGVIIVNRLNSFFILFERVKAESAILGKEETFWEKYKPVIVGIIVIVSLILIACLLFFLDNYIPKRKEKNAQKTITSDGVLIASAKACTVFLVGFQEITLAKGTEFAAPLHEKEGFDFGGWFYDSACTIPYTTTKIYKNITLYPKWVRHD